MKKIIFIILMLSICSFVYSQGKMNEQRTMKESHIDFTKEYIFFIIHGLIEIDGHIFKNDTCKCPIIFKANLDGVTIIDTCLKQTYTHRICAHKNCRIIHLIKKESLELNINPFGRWPNYNIKGYTEDSIGKFLFRNGWPSNYIGNGIYTIPL
jgi:hypothetical protein